MSDIHIVQRANTRTPLARVLMQGDQPVDMTGLTGKVFGEKDNSDAWIAETTTGVTAQGTSTFTTNTADGFDRLRHNGTLAKNGMQIVVSTTTTLPAGLSASTRYFVREADPNGFKVSLTPNGATIDITDAGTGTHSYYIVGMVQYDFQTADVATAGTFWLWFNVYNGSEYDTFPVVRQGNNRGLRVEVVEAQ